MAWMAHSLRISLGAVPSAFAVQLMTRSSCVMRKS